MVDEICPLSDFYTLYRETFARGEDTKVRKKVPSVHGLGFGNRITKFLGVQEIFPDVHVTSSFFLLTRSWILWPLGAMAQCPDQREQEVQGKVRKYEEFLNERLKADLQQVLEQRDAVYADLAEYLQLRNVIEKLRTPHVVGKELKTMVDLGANFYTQAKVVDASRIFVAVGLGFFVEFTHQEALDFIAKKVEQLTGKGQQLTEQASLINARIKLVLDALRELQFSNQPTEEPPRAVW